MKKGELLSAAIVCATNAHNGQYDRGGMPYILHPLAVMNILATTDEELMAIAVLHDVVEDTKITWADLRNIGMTDRVINGIRNLTKMPGQTQEEYENEVMSNIDSIRAKMADLTHNSDIRRLKGVTEKDIARMAKYHLFHLKLQQKLSELEQS